MKLKQLLFLLVCFIAILISCKKDETEEINYDLKTFNFSCDTALVTTDNCFLAVDYKTASIIKITGSGTFLWKKSDLFDPKDYQNKLDEKPYIRALTNGDFVICEQVVDSFKANLNQVYTHLLFSKINKDGNLVYQTKHITSTRKKILPFNIIENSNNELICIGVNETNEICGAISYLKIGIDGSLMANSNKTINTAAYWLNGIFYNARTYMNSLSISSDMFTIIQIGTQTSCFKLDKEGNVKVYKRFNYATEFDIQQQIDATSFWEYTISNFVSINDNELLLTGIRYAGSNYNSTKSYFQQAYVATINQNFDSIHTYRNNSSNFQYGAVPYLLSDKTIYIIGYDSEEKGDDNVLRVLPLNEDLTKKSNIPLPKIQNYQGIVALTNNKGSIAIFGRHNAFGTQNKHTFLLQIK